MRGLSCLAHAWFKRVTQVKAHRWCGALTSLRTPKPLPSGARVPAMSARSAVLRNTHRVMRESHGQSTEVPADARLLSYSAVTASDPGVLLRRSQATPSTFGCGPRGASETRAQGSAATTPFLMRSRLSLSCEPRDTVALGEGVRTLGRLSSGAATPPRSARLCHARSTGPPLSLAERLSAASSASSSTCLYSR